MTPDTQNDCLNRCLALQPLVGWPEWTHDEARWRLTISADAELARREYRTDTGRWRIVTGNAHHISLCIWQHHLLRRLAERGSVDIGHLPIGWSVEVYGAQQTTCDTLIEALLDVWEQIQREGAEDA